MSTRYSGMTRSQRDRRETLNEIKDKLGAELFSEFLIDTLSENGSTITVANLQSLSTLWMRSQVVHAFKCAPEAVEWGE